MPITILVSENHMIVRKGICTFLNSQEGIEIIGEVNTAKEAVEKAKELRPDIVIMDECLSVVNLVESTRLIKKSLRDTKVIILTTIKDDHDFLHQLILSRADAYISKQASDTDLISAIRATHNNKIYLCSFFCKALLESVYHCKHESLDSYSQLTAKEKNILMFVGEGLSNKQIAKQLDVSMNTVKNHKTNLMNKLNVHDSANLIRYCYKIGITKP